MKPSKFIKATYDTEALAERVATDAGVIVAFMRRASGSMQEIRNAYDVDPMADHAAMFDGLAAWQESMNEGLDTEGLTPAQKEAMLILIGAAPTAKPAPEKPRATRSDKGKPRKSEGAEQVNAATKARASAILALVSNSGPQTIPGLIAGVGGSPNEIGQALELTGLKRWETLREGDVGLVVIYGTAEHHANDDAAVL